MLSLENWINWVFYNLINVQHLCYFMYVEYMHAYVCIWVMNVSMKVGRLVI